MLNFRSREMSENPKGFLMSAKRLEQVALATKLHLCFRSRFTKVGMLAELAEQFSGVGQTLPKLQTR